ncbi:MAG: lamin tail domain-containing protein, partial [Acidimicrobiia bacterium]|nr:lamin tail domain-containing protein [Acidimicrobiia bacterium]
VSLADAGTDGNFVYGNLIGTDAAGVVDLGNNDDGVDIQNGASNNFVGGDTALKRNVISGNNSDGVSVNGGSSTGNTIMGNRIGTNAPGTGPIPNGDDGIDLQAASGTFIGGINPNEGNLISGNTSAGIHISVAASLLNTIYGNLIGTDVAGTGPIPNNFGVRISTNAWISAIGGTTASHKNVIAFNTQEGIVIESATAYDFQIIGNSIHGNGALGIDLDNDGVTPNNPADSGANELLNYPEITAATEAGGTVDVDFDLEVPDAPNGWYRIEFFSNSAADGLGFGEGETLVSTVDVDHTAGPGSLPFSHSFAGSAGDIVTATATECTDGATCSTFGSTSEFSAAVTVEFAIPASAGDIIINEFLYEQTTGGGNNDEFVEFFNASAGVVDISGWRFHSADLDPDYTFPGSTTLNPGEYAVVWIGDNTAITQAPGAAFQDWMGLKGKITNSGDQIYLLDSGDGLIDYVAFGGGDGGPVPPVSEWDATYQASLAGAATAQSISLTPNGVNGNDSACWEITTSTDASGRCVGYQPTVDNPGAGIWSAGDSNNNVGGNSAPTDIALAPSTVAENVPIGTVVGTFSTTDPDGGDTHTYALVAGLGDGDNGLFTIVGSQLRTAVSLDFETLGSSLAIRIETTDSGTGNLTYEEAMSVTLTDVNDDPVLGAIGNQGGPEGSPMGFDASATDPDVPAQTLVFSLDTTTPGHTLPAVYAWNANTGVFSWTPSESEGGTAHTFMVVVTDNGAPVATDTEIITLTANETNDPPVITNPGPQSDSEGDVVSLPIVATDPDLPSQTLTYRATGLPFGLAIDPGTGAISGTIASWAAGGSPFTVEITVDDGATGTDVESFPWTVAPVNDAVTANDDGPFFVAEDGTLIVGPSEMEFTLAFGSAGSGPGQFAGNRGVTIAADGSVYVVDTGNNRVQKFDASGTYLLEWGTTGTGPGQFDTPMDVAEAHDGSIYVSDLFNHRIQVFDSVGTYLFEFGTAGPGPGQFNSPRGLDFGPGGLLHVA